MKRLLTLCLFFFVSLAASAQNFEIYVSDGGNFNNPPWQILKFDGNGQNPVQFINSNLAWPQDILFPDGSGTVLISNLNSGIITRHDAMTGDYLSNFATGIGGPTRMKIGPDGLLYVLQWNGNGKVKRYNLNGTFVDDFTSSGVPQSIGIDWDATGNLYVSSYTGKYVRKYDQQGMDQGNFVSGNLAGPTNIWFNDVGELLVTDYNGTAVKRFDASGNYLNDFITGLSNAEGVDIFPNGNILIGNGATHSVKMFTGTGTYIQDLIPSSSGNLLTPNAIVIKEVTVIGVPESIDDQAQFIYPTIGSGFHITSNIVGSINNIEIFSMDGRIIKKAGSIENNFYDMSAFPAGAYIVHINLSNGTFLTRKFFISR